jgi:hypothetical protein
MTRPFRTIKPSAGQPSVPRERLREAARAVTREERTAEGPARFDGAAVEDGEPIIGISGDVLRHVARSMSRSTRRRRVAIAMRKRTERPNPGDPQAHRCLYCRRRIPPGVSVVAPVTRTADGRRAYPGLLHEGCADAWWREHDA